MIIWLYIFQTVASWLQNFHVDMQCKFSMFKVVKTDVFAILLIKFEGSKGLKILSLISVSIFVHYSSLNYHI